MAEWVLKYADTRGEIHQQTASAVSEQELRERYSQQGFLIYSVRPRRTGLAAAGNIMGRSKKLNLERFLIFNQQFVTPGSGGSTDSEGARSAGRSAYRRQSGRARQSGAGRSEERISTIRSIPAARRLSDDLHDFGDGRREERQPR
jgi:type II secretory pathway component PulF